MDADRMTKMREVLRRAKRTLDFYEVLAASGMDGDEKDQFERLMAKSIVDDLKKEGVSDVGDVT